MIYLSVVIPVYNEQRSLKLNVETIVAYLNGMKKNYEIILVNDGSTDSTASIIDEIIEENARAKCVSNPKNKGKGHAVRSGVLTAHGKYIVYTDADLAVPVHFVGSCVRMLETGVPLAIASRHLPDSSFKVREDPFRQFLGGLFRSLATWNLSLEVSDITCGLKGFEKSVAYELFSRSKINGWGYDAELIFLAQKLGYSISEIAVDWYHSFDSKVKIVEASIRTLIEMFEIRYYHLTDSYGLYSHGKR